MITTISSKYGVPNLVSNTEFASLKNPKQPNSKSTQCRALIITGAHSTWHTKFADGAFTMVHCKRYIFVVIKKLVCLYNSPPKNKKTILEKCISLSDRRNETSARTGWRFKNLNRYTVGFTDQLTLLFQGKRSLFWAFLFSFMVYSRENHFGFMYASYEGALEQFLPKMICCEEVSIEGGGKVPKYHMHGFHFLSNRIVSHYFKHRQILAATIRDLK